MDNEKYTVRSKIIRCTVILVGTFITGFGAACIVTGNLGSDPVTAFVQGMSVQLDLSWGMAMNIFNGSFFVLILIINRKLINIGTILYTFTLGVFADFFIWVLGVAVGYESSLLLRGIILVVGVVSIGIGLGVYQAAKFGIGPSDAFNQTMANVTKLPLKYERMIFDAVMVLGGWLMGGVVFIGTIIGMLGVGPIMAPTITRLAPIVDKWSKTAT